MSNSTPTNNCPNCGPHECYHICSNSPHFYSPEQERADEANYDPSEYYREGGFADPDIYPNYDDSSREDENAQLEREEWLERNPSGFAPPYPRGHSDDLPF